MKVTLTVEADELKIAQLLSKFAEKYRLSYKLNRQAKGFTLEVELQSDDFGEFIRRLNHIKDATYKIEEMRGGGLLDKFNVDLTRTNVDALIGKEAIAKNDFGGLKNGKVEFKGTRWNAESVSEIKEGQRVIILKKDSFKLIVEPKR